MKCPHCNGIFQEEEFCPHCGKILPVPEQESYFHVLGYDREFLQVDLADLERRLFELSKKFHPDRFASKSALEVQISHDRSSAINNAYRTLKNPVSRAKYMVERAMGSIEEKSEKVPPEMADLFFEVQDALDVIRESNGNPPEEALRQVYQAETDLKEKVKDLDAALQKHFSAYDATPGNEIIAKIKEIISERSYIKSFLRQVDSVLGRE